LGKSDTVTFTVLRIQSFLAIELFRSVCMYDEPQTVTVTVTGAYGEAIAGAYVTMRLTSPIYKTPAGEQAYVLFKGYTDANGKLSWTFKPSQYTGALGFGDWSVFADWEGNVSYYGCEEEEEGVNRLWENPTPSPSPLRSLNPDVPPFQWG